MTVGTAMKGNFTPRAIEQSIYEEWESKGFFAPRAGGLPYCIAIPPPNITGRLHMGHAFQHTLMDALIRFHRMSGLETLWQMGTDHAGIATQMLVEHRLETEGTSRDAIGRDAFIKRVWQWRESSGDEICQQLRRMGSSLDWDRERFTMDEDFSTAVREVFVRLYEDGLIYKHERLVNWDPELQTAVSDLEVENEDETGHLWKFRYPLSSGTTTPDDKNYIVIATTRPETMLGDTAVAVHPNDPRYQSLIGATVVLPLVGREIPIVGDEHVDPEFGTGCVKITPGHDFNDYEVGERHGLPIENIFNADASLNDNTPAAYQGLDRFEARNRVVEDLDKLGLLESIEDHTLSVPRGDRSGAIIEPWLTEQWWVDIKPLARPAIKAVEDGNIQFVPKQYENLYFRWMNDIQDWCISRQQWWGHRIPAWYDDAGNVFVGRNEAEAREKGEIDDDVQLTQDPSVLETWFSSSLWTFATLGWPENTPELEKFHPTDVLVTGHDIIFFWVARMIMMTLKFTGEIPFKKVYMHGLVRDADGLKMSKTKGNGLDPLDIIDGITLEDLIKKRTTDLTQPRMAERIEELTRRDFPNGISSYGTDAVRFTYCAMASPGRDIHFHLSRGGGYRTVCNKLWNATKFVLMNVESEDLEGKVTLSLADRWIRARARNLVLAAQRAIDTCRFDLYANAVYEFAWHEYCDWYVELAKPVLWDKNTDPSIARGVRSTLLEVLDVLLRTAHPLIPYITEKLWRETTNQHNETIMHEPFPKPSDLDDDPDAVASVEWLKAVVIGIRNIRGEMNISPKLNVKIAFQGGDQTDRERFKVTENLLRRLAKVDNIEWLKTEAQAPPASVQLVGNLKVMVPLEELIDVSTERERLSKEIKRLNKDTERAEAKLANENFVTKAPSEVVQKEREKARESAAQSKTLSLQLKRLDDL